MYHRKVLSRVSLHRIPLQWRHNERDGVSNHGHLHCLLNRLFKRRSKKTSKLRVTGLSEGYSPVTGEFPAQRSSNAENISIWWRHHGFDIRSRLTNITLNIIKRIWSWDRLIFITKIPKPKKMFLYWKWPQTLEAAPAPMTGINTWQTVSYEANTQLVQPWTCPRGPWITKKKRMGKSRIFCQGFLNMPSDWLHWRLFHQSIRSHRVDSRFASSQ